MSFPNFITVEDILPYIPEEHSEKFKSVDWEEVSYTTTSICRSAMMDYEITYDGNIFEKTDEGIEKLDYTGEIDFGTVLTLEEADYEISFTALFFKGELKELAFEKIDELDRTVREEAQKKIMNLVNKQDNLSKKWWYKAYVAYTKVVIFTFSCIRWLFGLFIKLCWMIQNKIT